MQNVIRLLCLFFLLSCSPINLEVSIEKAVAYPEYPVQTVERNIDGVDIAFTYGNDVNGIALLDIVYIDKPSPTFILQTTTSVPVDFLHMSIDSNDLWLFRDKCVSEKYATCWFILDSSDIRHIAHGVNFGLELYWEATPVVGESLSDRNILIIKGFINDHDS
jgi:hypothetical protein